MVTRYPVPTATPQPPPGFVDHAAERSFEVAHPRQVVWAWLNDPQTFIRGQPWPFFVEFLDGGVETGVRNTHSGPWLHCCGVIGDIRAGEYRDLVYLYGAYVLRMRWIRPTRLQFWVDEGPQGRSSVVRVRLDSHVRPWLAGIWGFVQRGFWRFFGWSMRSGVRKRERRLQNPSE